MNRPRQPHSATMEFGQQRQVLAQRIAVFHTLEGDQLALSGDALDVRGRPRGHDTVGETGDRGIDEIGATQSEFAGRDRKSVVEGKSVSVRVDLGGRRIIKKKKNKIIKN